MSKKLIVAGAFVVACLGVTVLALKKPSKPDPAPGSELAQNDPQPLSIYPVAANPPSSLTPIDSFGRDNLQGPAGTADLNPNRPFDNLGGAGLTGPGVIPFSGGSSLPGASSQPSTSQPGSALPPIRSPIGVIPTEAELNLTGLDLPAEDLERILSIDLTRWREEMGFREEHLRRRVDDVRLAIAPVHRQSLAP